MNQLTFQVTNEEKRWMQSIVDARGVTLLEVVSRRVAVRGFYLTIWGLIPVLMTGISPHIERDFIL